MNESKRNKIKESLRKTRIKRQSQRCKVFELKIDQSSLNKQQEEQLKMWFVEAKWLYNYILAQDNISDVNYKIKNILVKYKDKFIEKELKYLPSKCKQDLIKLVYQNIKSLSVLKRNGHKIGKLKFKREYNSIELSQYGNTHKIINKNKIKIFNIKKPLKVHGLEQIKDNYDLANAKLVKKASGYYIKLTCFEFVTFEKLNSCCNKQDLGLDFGIKNNVTTSEGEIFNCFIEESEHLKRLQRKLAKSKKNSNNRYKLRIKIQKEYEKITNKKNDAANKLVNYLLTNHLRVFMQDENLRGWHKGLFGKQVQHSYLGKIKSKLKSSNNVYIVDKWFPTTKMCYKCGVINENLTLKDRIFKCDVCNFEEDRDIKAAKTILLVGKNNQSYIPMEHRDFKPVEKLTSADDTLSIKNKSASMKQEDSIL